MVVAIAFFGNDASIVAEENNYVDDEEIIKAADWMNNYPRKVLGRTTAARRFNELLSA